MSFVTGSFYDTGSYISGTTDSFSNGSAYTTIFSPITYRYNGSIKINSFDINIPGISSHSTRPAKL